MAWRNRYCPGNSVRPINSPVNLLKKMMLHHLKASLMCKRRCLPRRECLNILQKKGLNMVRALNDVIKGLPLDQQQEIEAQAAHLKIIREIIRDTSHVLIISLEVVPCPSYRIFRGHNTDSFTRMIFRRDLWFQAIFFNGGRFG